MTTSKLKGPSLQGRVLVAALLTSFVMCGYAVDPPHYGRLAPRVEYGFVPAVLALIGAGLAKAVVGDARFLYGWLLTLGTLGGLWLGVGTVGSPPRLQPLQTALWVAAFTFAAAVISTLPSRSYPKNPFTQKAVVAKRASLPGRVLIAALLTTFAMSGFAFGPLHVHGFWHPGGRTHGSELGLIPVVLGPFIGAGLAKVVVGEARFLYGWLLALGTLGGLWLGVATASPLWSPPLRSTQWATSFTFAAALLSALPSRRYPKQSYTHWDVALVVLVLFLLLVAVPSLLRA